MMFKIDTLCLILLLIEYTHDVTISNLLLSTRGYIFEKERKTSSELDEGMFTTSIKVTLAHDIDNLNFSLSFKIFLKVKVLCFFFIEQNEFVEAHFKKLFRNKIPY